MKNLFDKLKGKWIDIIALLLFVSILISLCFIDRILVEDKNIDIVITEIQTDSSEKG